ncbi:TLD protein [Toxoplasma gondii GT1]|uniref:Oxidation resistance protein 1 n=2 Tax=Toxoplasma gondii TaxID=5811 RepID=S7UYB4_TOXGG|nr:TLD protein [Toxoplasma gondii GT1]KAF4641055.1 TLD protein [Toxoplasma gondii]
MGAEQSGMSAPGEGHRARGSSLSSLGVGDREFNSPREHHDEEHVGRDTRIRREFEEESGSASHALPPSPSGRLGSYVPSAISRSATWASSLLWRRNSGAGQGREAAIMPSCAGPGQISHPPSPRSSPNEVFASPLRLFSSRPGEPVSAAPSSPGDGSLHARSATVTLPPHFLFQPGSIREAILQPGAAPDSLREKRLSFSSCSVDPTYQPSPSCPHAASLSFASSLEGSAEPSHAPPAQSPSRRSSGLFLNSTSLRGARGASTATPALQAPHIHFGVHMPQQVSATPEDACGDTTREEPDEGNATQGEGQETLARTDRARDSVSSLRSHREAEESGDHGRDREAEAPPVSLPSTFSSSSVASSSVLRAGREDAPSTLLPPASSLASRQTVTRCSGDDGTVASAKRETVEGGRETHPWTVVHDSENKQKESLSKRGTALLDFWQEEQERQEDKLAFDRGEARCLYVAKDVFVPGILTLEREALKFRKAVSPGGSGMAGVTPLLSVSLTDIVECACVCPPPSVNDEECSNPNAFAKSSSLLWPSASVSGSCLGETAREEEGTSAGEVSQELGRRGRSVEARQAPPALARQPAVYIQLLVGTLNGPSQLLEEATEARHAREEVEERDVAQRRGVEEQIVSELETQTPQKGKSAKPPGGEEQPIPSEGNTGVSASLTVSSAPPAPAASAYCTPISSPLSPLSSFSSSEHLGFPPLLSASASSSRIQASTLSPTEGGGRASDEDSRDRLGSSSSRGRDSSASLPHSGEYERQACTQSQPLESLRHLDADSAQPSASPEHPASDREAPKQDFTSSQTSQLPANPSVSSITVASASAASPSPREEQPSLSFPTVSSPSVSPAPPAAALPLPTSPSATVQAFLRRGSDGDHSGSQAPAPRTASFALSPLRLLSRGASGFVDFWSKWKGPAGLPDEAARVEREGRDDKAGREKSRPEERRSDAEGGSPLARTDGKRTQVKRVVPHFQGNENVNFVLFGFFNKELAQEFTRAIIKFVDHCQAEHRNVRIVATHIPSNSNVLVGRWAAEFARSAMFQEDEDLVALSSPTHSLQSFDSVGSDEAVADGPRASVGRGASRSSDLSGSRSRRASSAALSLSGKPRTPSGTRAHRASRPHPQLRSSSSIVSDGDGEKALSPSLYQFLVMQSRRSSSDGWLGTSVGSDRSPSAADAEGDIFCAGEPEQEEMTRPQSFGKGSTLTLPLPDYEIPEGAPALLTNGIVSQLAVHLPLMLTMKRWSLAFCHKLHGISLNTFYRKCSYRGSCLLFLQDARGILFGAFLSEIRECAKYYGSAETFVFTFKGPDGKMDPEHPTLHVYRWSKLNSYFIYTDHDVLGIGGGGHYAISVDKDLLRGSSSCCLTFNSPVLSSSEDFIVKAFQVWTFEDY